jgi:hypothetical protein
MELLYLLSLNHGKIDSFAVCPSFFDPATVVVNYPKHFLHMFRITGKFDSIPGADYPQT